MTNIRVHVFVHRHALPLFTSLLNVVCAYDPVGYGIPYNHLLFSDYREQLVEQAVQILIVTLEHDGGVPHRPASPSSMEEQEVQHIRLQENRKQSQLQYVSFKPIQYLYLFAVYRP